MKRFAALLLAAVICFGFCGCKSSKTEKIGVDVEYYAKLGKIKELDFAIGDDGETAVKKIESSLAEDDKQEGDATDEGTAADGYDEEFCSVYEGDGYFSVSLPQASFNYDSESKEIFRIVSFSSSYGFDIGTVSIEIKKALSSYGFDSEERSLTEEERTMVAGTADDTCLEYKFGDNCVFFAFGENSLYATVIYKT